MTGSIAWLQVGDLHMDEATAFESLHRLEAIITEANKYLVGQADFVYLPGDNANHGTPNQYSAIVRALDRLKLPWRAIAGDHDFEPGNLDAYEAAFPPGNRPEAEVIAGYRCIFLDIVSKGWGGPDFRVDMHNRNRLARELSRAGAESHRPLVFMHAYPGDLAADGDEIATLCAEAGVGFVAVGHTHYNDLLNDGRVIYGATRSTSEIEEDNGRVGFSIVCLHDDVPSWRFKRLGSSWPHVQIVYPCDLRLMTRPSSVGQVPRPGKIHVVARSFGPACDLVLSLDGGEPVPMTAGAPSYWHADVQICEPGLHRLAASCSTAGDVIDVLVRSSDCLPKRRPSVLLGHACHTIGSWPQAGVEPPSDGPARARADQLQPGGHVEGAHQQVHRDHAAQR